MLKVRRGNIGWRNHLGGRRNPPVLSGGGRKAATGKPRCRLREGAKGVLAVRIGRGRRVDPLAVVPGVARG